MPGTVVHCRGVHGESSRGNWGNRGLNRKGKHSRTTADTLKSSRNPTEPAAEQKHQQIQDPVGHGGGLRIPQRCGSVHINDACMYMMPKTNLQ